MKKFLSLMLCLSMLLGVFALASCEKTQTPSDDTDNTSNTETNIPSDSDDDARKEQIKAELKNEFLKQADEVEVSEDSVTFKDATGNSMTIKKNPTKTVNLYASFTTLWYEAGGSVSGCIGGSSSQELYEEYIGRDITADTDMTVVATSSSGKKWDTESIIALNPDLIICSTAMSGYSTIKAPAEAANIPVIAVNYEDFSDYLKWFKVFCNLTGHAELWDSIAMKTLDEVADILSSCPTENTPSVFAMFSGADSLQANTSTTVVGSMINAMNATNIVDNWPNSTDADRLEINLETVFAADPDIIVIQCHAGADVAKEAVEETYGSDSVWNSLTAVKEGRVYYLEKTLFHNKPNSRFSEAYLTLAGYLYPDTDFSN